MPLKTEKEKMLAGECYNCLDPDLETDRQETKKLLRIYNLTKAGHERQMILKQFRLSEYLSRARPQPPVTSIFDRRKVK